LIFLIFNIFKHPWLYYNKFYIINNKNYIFSKIALFDFKYNYENFVKNTEYVFFKDNKNHIKSYGIKDWIRKRYNSAAAYYGINTNSISNDERHKLIEPRPKKKFISYETKITSSRCRRKRNICYMKFKNSLPIYNPNDKYFDENIPYLGINQYNKEIN